jgi:inosine-uridine nucleoside N-ribohydrolase
MVRLHVDTDIGGDIDDVCALALVLGWQGAELVGVTTVAEHAGRRAGYARYLLGLAGREDVPVAAGADASGGFYSEFPLLPKREDEYWPGGVESYPTPAVEALGLLERSIRAGAVVCAIGPLTNLALLERRTPGILREARLCLMGGFVFPPRAGFPVWDYKSDYNVQADAPSARVVFEHATRPTLVTLAVTAETALRASHLPALRGGAPSRASSRRRPRSTRSRRTGRPSTRAATRGCPRTSSTTSTTRSPAPSRSVGKTG